MGKDTKGFFRRKWFLRIISLILALFLFMYVNGSKSGFLRQNTRNNNQSSALMSNKSEILSLNATVDRNEFLKNGYLQDDMYKTMAYEEIVCKSFPSGLTSDSIILMTVG